MLIEIKIHVHENMFSKRHIRGKIGIHHEKTHVHNENVPLGE